MTKTKNGTRHAIKTAVLTAGFQEGGIENNDVRLLLVVTGKVHAFVETSNLLSIAIEHLRSDTVGVEQ